MNAGGPGQAPFSILAEFFDPDVVLRQADALPYGGIWRGHYGIEQFFTAMAQTWAEFEMVEQSFLAETNPLVVHTDVRGRSRTTGHEIRFPILQIIRIRDRRIWDVRPFYWDTAAIAAACVPDVSAR